MTHTIRQAIAVVTGIVSVTACILIAVSSGLTSPGPTTEARKLEQRRHRTYAKRPSCASQRRMMGPSRAVLSIDREPVLTPSSFLQ